MINQLCVSQYPLARSEFQMLAQAIQNHASCHIAHPSSRMTFMKLTQTVPTSADGLPGGPVISIEM